MNSNKNIEKDFYGRTWNGKNIGWLTYINSGRLANYKWKKVLTQNDSGEEVMESKLLYDRRRGMYDSKGYTVKEPRFDRRPVLLTETGWEEFPTEADEYVYFLMTSKYTFGKPKKRKTHKKIPVTIVK